MNLKRWTLLNPYEVKHNSEHNSTENHAIFLFLVHGNKK